MGWTGEKVDPQVRFVSKPKDRRDGVFLRPTNDQSGDNMTNSHGARCPPGGKDRRQIPGGLSLFTNLVHPNPRGDVVNGIGGSKFDDFLEVPLRIAVVFFRQVSSSQA